MYTGKPSLVCYLTTFNKIIEIRYYSYYINYNEKLLSDPDKKTAENDTTLKSYKYFQAKFLF